MQKSEVFLCICAHPLLGMENFCGYVDCGAEVLAKTKLNGFEVEREGVVLTLLLHPQLVESICNFRGG